MYVLLKYVGYSSQTKTVGFYLRGQLPTSNASYSVGISSETENILPTYFTRAHALSYTYIHIYIYTYTNTHIHYEDCRIFCSLWLYIIAYV